MSMAVDPFDDSLVYDLDVAVTFLEDFHSFPPECFLSSGSKLGHNADEANVFATNRKTFKDASCSVIEVRNIDELNLIKHRLLTQPTFLQVEIKRETKNPKSVTTAKCVVFVNTKSTTLQNTLKAQLQKCTELMKNNQLFRYKIKLSDMLESWFDGGLAEYDQNDKILFSEGSEICITNYSQKRNSWRNKIPRNISCFISQRHQLPIEELSDEVQSPVVFINNLYDANAAKVNNNNSPPSMQNNVELSSPFHGDVRSAPEYVVSRRGRRKAISV